MEDVVSVLLRSVKSESSEREAMSALRGTRACLIGFKLRFNKKISSMLDDLDDAV